MEIYPKLCHWASTANFDYSGKNSSQNINFKKYTRCAVLRTLSLFVHNLNNFGWKKKQPKKMNKKCDNRLNWFPIGKYSLMVEAGLIFRNNKWNMIEFFLKKKNAHCSKTIKHRWRIKYMQLFECVPLHFTNKMMVDWFNFFSTTFSFRIFKPKKIYLP